MSVHLKEAHVHTNTRAHKHTPLTQNFDQPCELYFLTAVFSQAVSKGMPVLEPKFK